MVSAPTVWLASARKMSEKRNICAVTKHYNPTQQRHDHGRSAAPIRVKRDTDDCTHQHESASHPGLYRGGPELSEELLHVRERVPPPWRTRSQKTGRARSAADVAGLTRLLERRAVQPRHPHPPAANAASTAADPHSRCPSDRNSIWGNSLSSKISARTALRVSGISNGSVIGRLANPRAVAVSSTRLVASPARSRVKALSSRVPRWAGATALSSAAVVSGGWESAVAANIWAGNSAVGPATGVLRAGTPASDPMAPDPGSAVDPSLLRCGPPCSSADLSMGRSGIRVSRGLMTTGHQPPGRLALGSRRQPQDDGRESRSVVSHDGGRTNGQRSTR